MMDEFSQFDAPVKDKVIKQPEVVQDDFAQFDTPSTTPVTDAPKAQTQTGNPLLDKLDKDVADGLPTPFEYKVHDKQGNLLEVLKSNTQLDPSEIINALKPYGDFDVEYNLTKDRGSIEKWQEQNGESVTAGQFFPRTSQSTIGKENFWDHPFKTSGATLADLVSMPGRAFGAYAKHAERGDDTDAEITGDASLPGIPQEKRQQAWTDFGQLGGEGEETNPNPLSRMGQEIVRDPLAPVTMAFGGPVANLLGKVAKVGKDVAVGTSALGKYVAAPAVGAGLGVAETGLRDLVNNYTTGREGATGLDYAVGGVAGGAIPAVGASAQAFGKKLSNMELPIKNPFTFGTRNPVEQTRGGIRVGGEEFSRAQLIPENGTPGRYDFYQSPSGTQVTMREGQGFAREGAPSPLNSRIANTTDFLLSGLQKTLNKTTVPSINLGLRLGERNVQGAGNFLQEYAPTMATRTPIEASTLMSNKPYLENVRDDWEKTDGRQLPQQYQPIPIQEKVNKAPETETLIQRLQRQSIEKAIPEEYKKDLEKVREIGEAYDKMKKDSEMETFPQAMTRRAKEVAAKALPKKEQNVGKVIKQEPKPLPKKGEVKAPERGISWEGLFKQLNERSKYNAEQLAKNKAKGKK
jgi:hypothetical protein